MSSRIAVGKPPGRTTPVNFDMPAGACDCHTHIFGDPQKFPLLPERVYTPEMALPEQLAEMHKALHLQRVVIVTPSVYGSDNSATLYGIQARGANARGVAVIDDMTSENDLDVLQRAGVCGIRINLATNAATAVNDSAIARKRFQAAVERLTHRKWHIQVNANLPMISAIRDLVASSRVMVVIDHFGGARADLGVQPTGFQELLELVHSGRAYVKISAAYRLSKLASDYSDVAPLAKALIDANPDRVLWGSDWPHPDPVTPPGRKPTDVTPLLTIDDGHLLNQLPSWAPDAAVRRKILVDNPARLYGF